MSQSCENDRCVSDMSLFGRRLIALSCRHVRKPGLGSALMSSDTSAGGQASDKDSTPAKSPPLPPAPQDCCMSGCEKCVWRVYAEELKEQLGDLGDAALAEALESIEDPSLKMFIKMELNVK